MWIAVAVCAVLSIAVLALSLKILLMKKSAREIEAGFRRTLTTDTNTRIDITTGDRAMRSLAVAVNEQLTVLRAEKQRFTNGDKELKTAVTNISHDLRTPLTAVYGYMQMLGREPLPPKAAAYVSVIAERIETLKDLTEELFKYSLITTEETDFTVEPVRVNELLENILLGYYGALGERNIAVTADICETPVVRMLNRGALARIFGNVLSNAIKYSDGDLSVTLSSDGELCFSNRADRLDEVTAGKLFDRFFTVESGRLSTGLGLSIARTLTERMDGDIRAEYADGRLYIFLRFQETDSAKGIRT